MNPKAPRPSHALGAALAAALLVSACSSTAKRNPSASATPTPSAVPTASPSDTPAVTSTPRIDLFMSGGSPDLVSLYDGTTFTVRAMVPNIGPMALSPNGSFLYSGTLTWNAISTATGAVVATVGGFSSISAIAASPDGARVWVADEIADVVVVLDASTNLVLSTLPISAPHRILIPPGGSRAFVMGSSPGTIAVWDSATLAGPQLLPIGSFPSEMVLSPDRQWLYVANWGDSSVSVIDAASPAVVATIALPFSPYGIAVTPDGSTVYAGSCCAGSAAIDTVSRTVVATIPCPGVAFAFAPNGSLAFFGGSATITTVNTVSHTAVASVPAGGTQLGRTADGTTVFGVNGTHTVAVLDAGTGALVTTFLAPSCEIDLLTRP